MAIDLDDYQTSLKTRVSLSGVGVHGGRSAAIHFNPADANTGIVFQRVDPDSEGREIRALVSQVSGTDLCTALGDPEGDQVGTVEHLMATLMALGIDNILIELEGAEIPIMDGSASAFVDALEEAGIETLDAKRRFIRVVKPVRMENGASWAEFRPHDGTRFEIDIDFASSVIGRQSFTTELSAAMFRKEIARARTFGFMKDVERLWAAGYALGSSLENSLVIGEDNSIINLDGLRYPDEFVRHKTLDAIGDLALAGARFIGCFRSYRGGHRLNAATLRALLSDDSAFEVVETSHRSRGRSVEMIAVNAPAFAPWSV